MEMELHNPIHLSAEATGASVLALILVLYCLVRLKMNTDNAKQKPPQPSGSWPIIGHLPLLRRGLPHITLGNLADKYGPIFMVKLGVHRVLVVSTSETAKECLGTNDKAFANRSHTIFMEHLGYNSLMLGFSPYGKYWREMRKMVVIELLSNHRLEMLKCVSISEVRSAMKVIHDGFLSKKKSSPGFNNNVIVDMKQWFNDINLNITMRLVAGKSLKEFYHSKEAYNKCVKALRDFFDLGGAFVPADAHPFLRWMDIGGYEMAMKKVAKEIDHVAQDWLDEHRARRLSGKGKEMQDFMDIMLEYFETIQNKPTQSDADTITKANSMALILAGTDTTTVTLIWALSLLINNRESLKKTQTEIDNHVGKDRQVDESDLQKLVYLQAVLKETMRLYPAGPLTQREAITDCTVSGYKILAGTQLYVNLYKIHRDPKLWANPLDFQPERFLTTHMECDIRGQNFELIPFGSGRRICPGISFALQSTQFTLANLLHGFDISTPSDKAVDMTEGLGMTNLKATPLEVLLSPRLPDHVYKL
ncbi:cytochrome P450 CYP82D47-like [Spinacia oleracea]|uniref:Cytochrome P450 CYP82D47-like n=1 Tax=Spinacia oleracea TaxID=3562 RepID=A0ABM3QNS2_SPIOL|nr:cytochrome P450 CYP82D47-like [Spinacia oleracea]